MESDKPLPIGTRVVAVSHNEGKTLNVFGRGIFEGYFLPPQIDPVKAVADIQQQYATQRSVTPDLLETFTERDAKIALLLSETEPRIRLTETIDGTPIEGEAVVWGSECWWGDVETFEKKAEGYTLVTITIEKTRANSEKLAQMEEEFRSAVLGSSTRENGVRH